MATMADASTATGDRVNAFEIGSAYYFRHYFDGEAVFDELRYYYDNQQYRFEVPTRDFQGIRKFLSEHGYTLVVVRDFDPYVVVVRKYRAHPENVFKAAVYQWSTSEYNCFLLKDRDAVETALAQGATLLAETNVDLESARAV
jgi:hypothetical protein